MAYEPNPGSRLAKFFRIVAALLSRWPLILLALFFYSPEGPHVWFATQERASANFADRMDCIYIGSRGIVRAYIPGCPTVVWLDSREWR